MRYRIAAIGSVGANATTIIRMLAGKWVKTIVLIKPILSAILAAAMNEKAVTTPEIDRMYDIVERSAPNLA
jgi:hypothetical protein